MRRLVVTIADLHSGHALGLCNPETEFLDEDEDGNLVAVKPTLRAIQGYLWELYTEHRERLTTLADGDDIILLVDGDICHGNAHLEHLMRTRISDQVEIGVMNLVPWLEMDNVSMVRIQVGTDAHNLSEGSLERLVADRLRAMYPDKDIQIHYHSLLDIDGVRFDIAHHGPGQSSRLWLEGNTARYYLRDIMLKDILRREHPPEVIQRAHFHAWVREWLEVEDWCSWLVVVPSYCALGSYGHKVTRSMAYQEHGCVAYEIVDGRLIGLPKKMVRRLDLRTKERIN